MDNYLEDMKIIAQLKEKGLRSAEEAVKGIDALVKREKNKCQKRIEDIIKELKGKENEN